MKSICWLNLKIIASETAIKYLLKISWNQKKFPMASCLNDAETGLSSLGQKNNANIEQRECAIKEKVFYYYSDCVNTDFQLVKLL